jgi:class 3 adenylate cyclase
MQAIQDRALLLEALSDKVLHQLPAAVWKGLFLGPGRETIRFEQRHLTLVHADLSAESGHASDAVERFHQTLQRLNARHHGRLDPYQDGAALLTFENPRAAVRLAIELQRAAEGTALRIGVVSGVCTLAYFRIQGRLWCTPLGRQPLRAAEVAASATVGGIVISPETYGPDEGQESLLADSDAPDFRHSELDLSSLTWHDEPPAQFLIRAVDIPC